ncbi:hypothetical protein [Cryobacterium sp. Y57]|uniref:hypothetical protein n=1 Tax=Cryobacterium sp. Y57 TaxID=2048287 RepID=UPI000CE3178A|nr:hypothetical protein [Cryobacterium sp. Y57]
MTALMRDIQNALDAKLWVIALHAAFILPDVNAAVRAEDGETSGNRYAAWYDTYMTPKYPLFPGKDAYRVRCKLLHQGLASAHSYRTILFTTRDEGFFLHNNAMGGTQAHPDMLNIDIEQFCTDMLEATELFNAEEFNNPVVISNFEKAARWTTVTFHPHTGVGTIRVFTSDVPTSVKETATQFEPWDGSKLVPLGPDSVAEVVNPDGTTRSIYAAE